MKDRTELMHAYCILGIQIRNLKNDLNMEALGMGCRNGHWSQCSNQILISSTGLVASGPAVVVQAALESRAACCTTTARPEATKPVDEIKIWSEHCDQCPFLQPQHLNHFSKFGFGHLRYIYFIFMALLSFLIKVSHPFRKKCWKHLHIYKNKLVHIRCT